MRMSKFLIFKVNDKILGIKASQLVNILKNVTLPTEKEKNKLINRIDIWGMSIPYINLHHLYQYKSKDKVNILLAEIITEKKKKEIIGLTYDEITEVTMLDDLLSYPFNFQSTTANSYKEVIVNYENKPLTILNLPLLWKSCEGKNVFPAIYLAN
ncbi:MAG: chemotaxis protein CheW [Bacteroidales bacterium]